MLKQTTLGDRTPAEEVSSKDFKDDEFSSGSDRGFSSGEADQKETCSNESIDDSSENESVEPFLPKKKKVTFDMQETVEMTADRKQCKHDETRLELVGTFSVTSEAFVSEMHERHLAKCGA